MSNRRNEAIWLNEFDEVYLILINGLHLYLQFRENDGEYVFDYTVLDSVTGVSDGGMFDAELIRPLKELPAEAQHVLQNMQSQHNGTALKFYEGCFATSALSVICDDLIESRARRGAVEGEPIKFDDFWANVSDAYYGQSAGSAFVLHMNPEGLPL